MARVADREEKPDATNAQGSTAAIASSEAKHGVYIPSARALMLVAQLPVKMGFAPPEAHLIADALRSLGAENDPRADISYAINHTYGNFMNGQVLALLDAPRAAHKAEKRQPEVPREATPEPAGFASDLLALANQPRADVTHDLAGMMRRAQAELLPAARQTFSLYQVAGKRGDGAALREHAAALLGDVRAIGEVRDQVKRVIETGDEAAGVGPSERTQWFAFKAVVDALFQQLAGGVGPGALGGRVQGAPEGAPGSIANQIHSVIRIVDAADQVLGIMARDPRAPGEIYDENNAVRLMELWRGRPTEFFFLSHVVRSTNPDAYVELFTGIKSHLRAEPPRSTSSGRSLDELGQVARTNAMEFGQDTDVGKWDPEAARGDGRAIVYQVLSAKGGGRARLLHKVFKGDRWLEFASNLLPQEALELDAEVPNADHEVKAMLRMKWKPWAEGERRETLSHLIDRFDSPRIRALLHTVRNFTDAGFGAGHDRAIEAEDEGEITTAEASQLQAQNAVTTLSSLAAAVGVAQVGGAIGHALGDAISPIAGKSAPALIGAAAEGAFAGAGSVAGADYARNMMGVQDGLSSPEDYVRALALGGIMATAGAGGKLAYRAVTGNIGGGGGIVSVEMTVADLRRLGRTINQDVEGLIGALTPEGAPAAAGEGTRVTVTVDTAGVSPANPKGANVLEARIVEPQGTKGAWNKKLNKPQGGNTYEIEQTGYEFQTDKTGRTNNVRAKLVLEEGQRNTYQQVKAGGSDRMAGDQGGHLIANIFKGPGEGINLVAMGFDLNNGAWKALEGKWAKALNEGKSVSISIDIRYEGSTKRPSAFEVSYQISEGRSTTVVFENTSAVAKTPPPAPPRE